VTNIFLRHLVCFIFAAEHDNEGSVGNGHVDNIVTKTCWLTFDGPLWICHQVSRIYLSNDDQLSTVL